MFVVSLLAKLPLRLLYKWADILAFLLYRVIKYRNKVVRYNIDLCFPELSPQEREKIVHRYYKHFSDLIIETIWFGGCRNAARLRHQRIVEIRNPELLNELSQDGRSIVILSSHFGNWELIGGILNYNIKDIEFPFAEDNVVVVYKNLSSQTWNKFMRVNRTMPLAEPEKFDGYVETHDILRYVLRHRSEQKFYHFITDQRPYRAAKGTVPVTFLGQECTSMAAAANLALRFGFNILYQRNKNVGRGHYTIEYIPISSDPSKVNAQDIMNRYYELLSTDIKEQPEQYLWSHKRFPIR